MSTPAPATQFAWSSGSGNLIVQITGDHNTVNTQGLPYLTLVPPSVRAAHARRTIDAAKSRLTANPEAHIAEPDSLLGLLDPYLDIIRLRARGPDLDSLKQWLDSPAPISIAVLIGRAGAGKTRFAAEALRAFCPTPDGPWLGGFLPADRLASFVAQHNFAEWRWPKHFFAVVDYASASLPALLKWTRELADLPIPADPTVPRLRILLLDRHASTTDEGWYQQLRSANLDRPGAAALFEAQRDAQLRRLTPLPDSDLSDRRDLLAEMLTRAAEFSGTPSPPLPNPTSDPAFDARLSEPLFADPLYLLMAALVAHDVGAPVEALALSRKGLAHHLARLEGIRLDRFGPRENPAANRLRRHVAAVATLAGGLSVEEAKTECTHAAQDLGLLYPGGDGICHADLATALGSQALPAIGLDIIGEAFLLQNLAPGAQRVDGAHPLESFHFLGDPAVSRLAARAVPVLIRAAQDFSTPIADSGRLWIRLHHGAADAPPLSEAPWPDPHPAPLKWLTALAGGDSVDSLFAIAAALPHESLALRDLASDVTSRLLRLSSTPSGHTPEEPRLHERALYHNELGFRLSEQGRCEDALAAAEEAVRLYRQLTSSRPGVFLPNLAGSLSNVAKMLSDLGRREDALAAAEEAVRLFRQLALSDQGVRPDGFLPNLAGSLNNVAKALKDLGRREDALAAVEEAVRLNRLLAATQPDAFLPNLAMSLNNVASTLSDLGRPEEALAAAAEAVRLRRQLAAARPDAFLPNLAMALNTFAKMLSELGRREDALDAVEQSVRLYRQLAAARPDAFRPNLAMALSNVAKMLSDLGRREYALAAAEEAVRLYLQLAAARPDAFLSDLARSLGARGEVLSAASQHSAATESFHEGIATLSPHFLRLPTAYAPLMSLLFEYYIQSAQAAQSELDLELLQPILAVLKPGA